MKNMEILDDSLWWLYLIGVSGYLAIMFSLAYSNV